VVLPDTGERHITTDLFDFPWLAPS
jgi:hypothetical protein